MADIANNGKKNGDKVIKPSEGRLYGRGRMIKALKARADAQRTIYERIADWMTATFGSPEFLILNVLVFTTWILINTGKLPGIQPFDPYPFILLTSIVSLEAIMLAIIVLMSQKRSTKTADLREETDLQVNILMEEEITKILEVLVKFMKEKGVDFGKDQDIQKMLEATDVEGIEKTIDKQLSR